MTKTADQFHPGDPTPGTSYGDVSGEGTDAVVEDAVPGGEVGGGERPMDECAYDEDETAD